MMGMSNVEYSNVLCTGFDIGNSLHRLRYTFYDFCLPRNANTQSFGYYNANDCAATPN